MRFIPKLPPKVTRALCWLIVLSLPVTLSPVLTGIIYGVSFSFWYHQEIERNTERLTDTIERDGFFPAPEIPGGMPTFRQFQDRTASYKITVLHTNNWATKLNFVMPNEHVHLNAGEEAELGVDNWANLEGLMRDVSCTPDLPEETWVYISGYTFPQADHFMWDWDRAFDKVVQWTYAHDSVNASQMAFVECASDGFLCGVWGVRSPALMHFLVLPDAPTEEEMNADWTYPTERENLRPVEVRVIELPLRGQLYTGIPVDKFAGQFEQMLGIMTGERFYEQFEQHSPVTQLMTRFQEMIDRKAEKRGTAHFYKCEADRWVMYYISQPLGIEDALVGLGSLMFTISIIVTEIIRFPLHLAFEVWQSFLGAPPPAHWGQKEEPERDFFDNPNWVNDLFDGMKDTMRSEPTDSYNWGTTDTKEPAVTPTEL